MTSIKFLTFIDITFWSTQFLWQSYKQVEQVQLCIKTLRILIKTSIILRVGKIITKYLENLWFNEFLNRSRVPSRRNIASFPFLPLKAKAPRGVPPHKGKLRTIHYIGEGGGGRKVKKEGYGWHRESCPGRLLDFSTYRRRVSTRLPRDATARVVIVECARTLAYNMPSFLQNVASIALIYRRRYHASRNTRVLYTRECAFRPRRQEINNRQCTGKDATGRMTIGKKERGTKRNTQNVSSRTLRGKKGLSCRTRWRPRTCWFHELIKLSECVDVL